jgi:hypothetical protein
MGDASRPLRDEARLAARFGSHEAADLMPQVRRLEEEFYSLKARFTVEDLTEMGEVAAHEFRTKHPEISDDAVKAFAWCYTYDYK